jgi:hypothetical protein
MGRLTANILADEADIGPPPSVMNRTEFHRKRFLGFVTGDGKAQRGGDERVPNGNGNLKDSKNLQEASASVSFSQKLRADS